MPTDPIRVGIIGVHPEQGWATAAHIPALKRLPEFRIEAISNSRLETAQAAAKKFGIARAFGSTEELLASPDIDLAIVTVRVPLHRAIVSQAIAAGKPVFSEWPLGRNLLETTALRDYAANKDVPSYVGLQTRAAPAFAYSRDLVKDGYVGDVLSATVIGAGILWGEGMSESYSYTLDPDNGAGMLNVPFAHSIDGLLHALDTRFETVSGLLANARTKVRIFETGADRPLTVPDQIVVAGTLENGATVSAHFRGGLSRATNFHVEINGTRGDLVITSPIGYVGTGGTRLMGARHDDALHELAIPEVYGANRDAHAPVQNIAIAYERIASDFRRGTRLAPTFDDAVALHRLVDSIERSKGTMRRL